MKNYSSKEELVRDVNEELKGYVLYHESFGDGKIEEIYGSNNLVFKVNFLGNVKKLSLIQASKHMKEDNNLKVALEYSREYERLVKEENEEKTKAYLKDREEKAKAEEEAEKNKAYNDYVENITNKVYNLYSKAENLNITEEDWIRNNIKRVNAQVPDFLADWFSRKFPDAKFSVIDSHRKTSGGYNMKWGLSLSASVKSVEVVPDSVRKYIHNKKITDTEYLFGLCLNYGVKIGK